MVDFNNILSGITSDYLGFIDNLNVMINSSKKSNDELNDSLRYVFDIISKNDEKETKMTKFKDVIFEENVAIHCPEEWMAKELLEYADSNGYKWCNKDNYTDYNSWEWHKKNTVYIIERGTYSGIESAEENNYKILHYNEVAIKEEEKMETKLEYELIIKGRKAEIGSELWHKGNNGECEKVTIYSIILYDGKNIIIRVENDKKTETKRHWLYHDMFTKGIDDILFWEKPTLYQLPDTDGNLSEVKVGQEVYLTEIAINKTKKHKISKLYDGCIYFNDTLFVWNCTGYGYVNFGGVNRLYYKTTTNKPHRDFSDCMDWSHAPKDAIEWRVTIDGYAFWYSNAYCERSGLYYDYDCGMYYISAGYRADLLNENGVVEDWEYSLVKRPNNK